MKFTMMKTLTMASAFLLGTSVLASVSYANDGFSQKEYENLFKSDPEFTAPTADAVRAGSSSMSCYVDTPAFDYFTTGSCFSAGFSRTTTAVFRIDNLPSNYSIDWHNSNCNDNNDTCFLSISHYQTITLSATVFNNSNSTFQNVSATAHYEGYD